MSIRYQHHDSGVSASNSAESDLSTGGCPGCGRVVPVVDVDEAVCPDCDAVVEGEPISREGPPLYDARDWNRRKRCGRRTTSIRSDGGVGTIPPERWPHWKKPRTHTDRRLDYAFGEIKRMSSKLNIPEAEREEAGQLYKRCWSENLLVGRSVHGFVTACLLVVVRDSDRCPPILLTELRNASRAERYQVQNARRVLFETFDDVGIDLLAPEDLVPRITSSLGSPFQVERTALEIARAYVEHDHGRCFSPATVAGAAVHGAQDRVEATEEMALRDIAAQVDVDHTTISSRKSDVLAIYDSWPEDGDSNDGTHC